MAAPRLIFDIHLDLSLNGLDFNRDLRWTHERIRRREIGMKDVPGRRGAGAGSASAWPRRSPGRWTTSAACPAT
jgi:hypothetical protein